MEPISELFYKILTRSELSAQEKARLDEWIAENDYNRETARRLSDLSFLEKEYHLRKIIDPTKAQADMQQRIARLSPIRQRWQLTLMAAAVIAVLTVGFTVKFMLSGTQDSTPAIASTVTAGEAADGLDAIRHGRTMALLTDESGKTLALNNDNDVLIPPGDFFVNPANASTRKIEDLKLEVPRGGEFKITLEDSTEVWLNSESTLRYPEVFGPDSRRVEITGEAYFAVKHDASRPFYVVTGDQEIRVYGTTFNIRSYLDDEAIFTTLESGSIAMTRLDGTRGELKLSPGHQAVFDKSDSKVTLRVINPTIVTSWRKGKFVFDEQPLSTIMRDLGRWYDFKYEFADPEVANVVFKGSIPRYADFKEAIRILEYSGGIQFSVADDRIVVGRRL